MASLSEKLTKEITKILPSLRKDLQLELYRSVGYLPKADFYSDSRVFGEFYNEADRYLSLVGYEEVKAEQFCSGDIAISKENRKIIYKIATLALVQLAMG